MSNLTMLQRIERYLREKDMPPTRFGRLAINDPCLVSNLRNGRELRPATIARIERLLNR